MNQPFIKRAVIEWEKIGQDSYLRRIPALEGLEATGALGAGADTAINRKWWDFMADIMETNEDNSPVSVDLPVLFHMD